LRISDEIKRTATGPSTVKESFIGRSGWETFKTALHDLQWRTHPYQTIIVDTAEMLWLRCVRYHTITHGVEHENEGALGYGKGLDLIARDFADTLAWLHRLPLGLILISHSEEREYTLPDGKTKRTRIVCNLPKRALQVVNGMVDLILYASFEGDQRVLKTRANPNYDAGSRVVGLAETIPMSYEALVSAYTAAINGSENHVNTKATLIRRIFEGETLLAKEHVDGFDVEKRRNNSREKHAGVIDLKQCSLVQLESYLQHLQAKYLAEHETKPRGETDGIPSATTD